VTYSLSEPATVKFTVEGATDGRLVGGKCVKTTKKNRTRRRRCTRFVALAGSFTHPGSAGRNAFVFAGRLRNRALRPGAYRLVAVAVDAAGKKSEPQSAGFRIKAG
jgi:hypothetical protein